MMKRSATLLSLLSVVLVSGCRSAPPPPRVPVPANTDQADSVIRYQTPKPLPDHASQIPVPGAFHDDPLVKQPMPEQQRFVTAYNNVGRPTIALIVNRNLDGSAEDVDEPTRVLTEETVRESTGTVRVEDGGFKAEGRNVEARDTAFESDGPARYTERRDQLIPGQERDDLDAARVDYDLIEAVMLGWLAADGNVAVLSPELPAGTTQPVGADVVVTVRARPTRQSEEGLRLRLVANAVEVSSGLSLGTATVDMDSPLTKERVNTYTRFLARKLMDDLASTWSR